MPRQTAKPRILNFMPIEILLALSVFLFLGIALAIWTMHVLAQDVSYENYSVWQIDPPVKQRSDFFEEERSAKQKLTQAAKSTGPSYADASIALGRIYLANGRWQPAIDCFENGLKATNNSDVINHRCDSLYLSLAQADRRLGKFDDCLHWLALAKLDGQGSAKTSTNNALVPIDEELVLAYAQRGDLAKAKQVCTSLLPRLSANAAAFWHCQLADLDRRTRDTPDAKRLYQKGLVELSENQAFSSQIARARFGLALVDAQEGNLYEANLNFKLALRAADASEGGASPLARAIKHAYALSLWRSNWIAALAMTFTNGESQ